LASSSSFSSPFKSVNINTGTQSTFLSRFSLFVPSSVRRWSGFAHSVLVQAQAPMKQLLRNWLTKL
jgi:hypothetical protein